MHFVNVVFHTFQFLNNCQNWGEPFISSCRNSIYSCQFCFCLYLNTGAQLHRSRSWWASVWSSCSAARGPACCPCCSPASCCWGPSPGRRCWAEWCWCTHCTGALVSWRQQVAWCEDLLRVWSLYQERVATIYTLPGHQQYQQYQQYQPSSVQLVQDNQLFGNWIFEKFQNILTFFFKQFYMKIDNHN